MKNKLPIILLLITLSSDYALAQTQRLINTRDMYPSVSPDGETIVFADYVGEDNNDVFTIKTDGNDLKQLTNSPGYDGHPHWSLDGQRIVFNSDRTSPDPTACWKK